MQRKVVHPNTNPRPAGVSAVAGQTAKSPSQLRLVTPRPDDDARYRMLFENSLDGVVLSCPDGQVLEVNSAGCEMFGRTADEIRLIGRAGLLDLEDPRLTSFLEQRERTGKATGELHGKHSDGTKFPIEVSAVDFLDAHGQARSCIIFRDITERTKSERALQRSRERLRKALVRERQMARHDSLTGAYNIRAFFEIAEAELLRAKRYSTHYSLAYFDLDNFKSINDRLGHAAGDDLLVSVVRAVQGAIRKIDVLARLGGDEFALLMPHTAPDASEVVVRKIQRVLRELAMKTGLPVSVSIGLVSNSTSELALRDMLRAADKLMYEAKHAGGDRVAQSWAADAGGKS
jgi:diguanylate cyclase (GGDEF)-like protein/PAS domain S-box-containing protein